MAGSRQGLIEHAVYCDDSPLDVTVTELEVAADIVGAAQLADQRRESRLRLVSTSINPSAAPVTRWSTVAIAHITRRHALAHR
jgi:hypothetical protein